MPVETPRPRLRQVESKRAQLERFAEEDSHGGSDLHLRQNFFGSGSSQSATGGNLNASAPRSRNPSAYSWMVLSQQNAATVATGG